MKYIRRLCMLILFIPVQLLVILPVGLIGLLMGQLLLLISYIAMLFSRSRLVIDQKGWKGLLMDKRDLKMLLTYFFDIFEAHTKL